MPTGYTAGVGDGKVRDFRTFALQCARQFGACIMQRDEATASPPRTIEPSDYHAKRITEVTAELVRLQGLSLEQAGIEADAEWTAHIQMLQEYALKKRETEDRYRSMIRKVEKWTPPTNDHKEMKSFMLSQLRESIEFDCSVFPDTVTHQSGKQWLTAKRGKAARDIGYHTAENAKEIERAADRNAWITALYDSLESSSEPQ